MQRRLDSMAMIALIAMGCVSLTCAEPATLLSRECRRNEDCDSGLCLNGRCVPSSDLPLPTDAQPDGPLDWGVEMADSDVPGDMACDREEMEDLLTDPSPADTELLGFGEPCTANSQCLSGYCIDFGESGRICTRECYEECEEEGFTCRLITSSGSDATWLCVPQRNVLCQPCEYHTDCGGFGNYCLQQDDGSFCATDCRLTGECPDHYVCNGIILPGAGPEGEDVQTNLCEPTIHECSGCVDNDEDGYGAGWTCLGLDCDDLDPDIYLGAPERCNYRDDDCDGITDEGIDLMTSLDHCGECDNPCHPLANEVTECQTGECVRACAPDYWDNDPLLPGCEYYCVLNTATGGVEICNFADDDCDGVPDDGFDIQNDPAYCGDCTPCDLPYTDTHECVRGECRPLTCDEGRAHCDDDYANGCEQDIWYDILHCGSCDWECSFDHAIPLCGPSGCYFTSCSSSDYGNCNSVQEDGCESDLRIDPLHCGSCGNDCHLVYPHAQVACDDRTCEMGACDPYYYDLRTDLAGCEYGPCYGDPESLDLPDSGFVDADCDGIDGDIDRAVFVAPSPAGSDGSSTCSMTSPCATITRALAVAVSRGATQVLVRAGTYSGLVELSSTHSGIGIYGGYNQTWQRGDRDASGFVTTLSGGLHSGDGEYMTIRARSVTATLANLRLNGPNAAGRVNDNGRSSYVVHAAGSTLTIQNITFVQGNGVAGLAGSHGSDYSPTTAPGGGDGGDNREAISWCDDSWGGVGGTGYSNCSATEARGGNGGAGGKMDSDCSFPYDYNATSGLAGNAAGWSQSTYPYYGIGGSAGKTCRVGGNGYNGRNGTDGSGGTGGTSAGTLYSSNGSQFWTARDGNNGSLGSHGTGGGGGGGGGGCDEGTDSDGAGGGGGGAGGCRAASYGRAGNGGGGSFGILGISSTLTVQGCSFTRGTAGAGGAGGIGGRGQNGGASGPGGGGQGEGLGGDGGAGGRGGHSGGGGGGAGGHSYGIYTYSSTVSQSSNSFSGGAYGAGGSAGTSPGNNGTSGANGILGNVGVFSY
ncbi:MAG: putative metal-binding motif-containing protein [Bradymonadales bacterium]|nr:putative metal-binding motif-containing protein [Bradymonadales bacterium]